MSRSISRVIVFVVVCVLGFGGAAMAATNHQVRMAVAGGVITNKTALANMVPTLDKTEGDTIEWIVTPQATYFQVLQLEKKTKGGPGRGGAGSAYKGPFTDPLPMKVQGTTTPQGPPQPNTDNIAYEFTIVVFDASGNVTDVWSHNPHFFVGP